jgi:hypothetical protein
MGSESCDWKVVLKNGRKVNALEEIMEGFYLARIEKMLDEGGSSETDMTGFNVVKATLQGLSEGRLEYFIDGLDWVTKKMLIDEYAQGDMEEALGICNQYTLIDDTVLAYLEEPVDIEQVQTTFDLERSFEFAEDAIPGVDWNSFGRLASKALKKGPEGTREYFRCLVAREFPFMVKQIEWERITFPYAQILLNEPFGFNREMCGDSLEEATANLDSFMNAVSKLRSEGGHIVPTPVEEQMHE